ncbi:MAG: molybdenum cofactor guanylyltransferase MobA [Pseudomonadota bacterium]
MSGRDVGNAIAEPIVGVVLAGGLSRRMGGGDKGLLNLGDRSMIGHVVSRLHDQAGPLVINANGDPDRFAALGLPVQPDTIDDTPGPLAGILAGLIWARTNAPTATHVASVSSDAPFVPRDLVAQLRAALAEAPDAQIALARSDDGLHPVIGLWPVALADDLDRALRDGVRKVLHWTDRHGTTEVHFDPVQIGGVTVDPFFNANTPDDLARARALIDAADVPSEPRGVAP